MRRVKTSRQGNLRKAVLGTASVAALTMSSGIFLAKGAYAQDSSGSSDVEQVVVTGSRIETRGFTSPTPSTTLSPEDLQVKGITEFQDLFNDIPQLAPFTGSATGSQNIGNADLNLRGLGTSRTLVLVDGRRFANTSPTGGVDTNVFPAQLIQSVTTVTGGSSAAYGSDAVAGVVNITLDTRFEGLKAEASVGETQYSDYQEASGAMEFGTSFLNDKAHLIFAVDFLTHNGVLQGDRSWGLAGIGVVPNPACGATCPAGQTGLVHVPDVNLSTSAPGGVITSGPLRGIQFGPGGAIEPFNYGSYVGTTFQSGGDGTNDARYAAVEPALHTSSGFVHTSYDLPYGITAWAEGLYSVDSDSYWVIPNYDVGTTVENISINNAFLPAQIRQMMQTDGITNFTMGRANEEMGWNHALEINRTQRYAFGFDGSIGDNWAWHTYAQYSFNTYYEAEGNNEKVANWKNAQNSIANPAVGGVPGVPVGAPVCVSTLTNPTNGCVPANLFGQQGFGTGPAYANPTTTWSPSLLNYIEGTSWYNETNVEDDYAFNISGTPFSDWAGDVSLATGGEWRREATSGTSDPLSQVSGWRMVNAQPLKGEYTVGEGYVESDIPVLNNMFLAKEADIDAAGRITNYSTSGTVETWKLGANYQPIDDLRFRSTWSQDIRAPNINELFQTRGENNGPITNPANNQTYQTLVLTGGNPDLKPEMSKTSTVGGVYTPSWLDGFSASVDYYDVNVRDAIATTAQQLIVNDCYEGQTAYCSQIVKNAAGVITQVSSIAFNAQSIHTEGWDVEAEYRFSLADASDSLGLEPYLGHPGGNMELRFLGSNTEHLVTVANGANQPDAAGATIPKWRWNITATYINKPYMLSVEGVWIGNSLWSPNYTQGYSPTTNTTIDNNQIDGQFIVDVRASYDIRENIQLFGRIDDLFNVNPPIDPGQLNVVHESSGSLYYAIGRDFLIGVRLKY
jgi:iron complex outermembrane recepter protein